VPICIKTASFVTHAQDRQASVFQSKLLENEAQTVTKPKYQQFETPKHFLKPLLKTINSCNKTCFEVGFSGENVLK
jgi:hypothetical protein